MKMISIAKSFTVAFALVICIVSAKKPNPCGFQLDGNIAFKCKEGTTCATTLWFLRKPFCAKQPLNPACICPAIFKPVCCRVPLRYWGTITVTESNSCTCGCSNGKVLFEGKCNRPPSKLAPCPRIFRPTCCYIRKFDLTVTASNKCICESVFGGVSAKQSICGIKFPSRAK